MIAKSPGAKPQLHLLRAWSAPLLLMALIAVLELLGDGGRDWLAWRRQAILDGQWWRLVTGNFVHLGAYHLMLNEIALLVLMLWCPQPLPPRVWLRRLALLSLAVGIGLLAFVPGLSTYVGLSGVTHGLFVLGLVPLVRRGDRIALAGLLYLCGKLAWEALTGVPVSDARAIGGHVVTQAHLIGALAALAYGLAFGSFTGREEVGSAER